MKIKKIILILIVFFLNLEPFYSQDKISFEKEKESNLKKGSFLLYFSIYFTGISLIRRESDLDSLNQSKDSLIRGQLFNFYLLNKIRTEEGLTLSFFNYIYRNDEYKKEKKEFFDSQLIRVSIVLISSAFSSYYFYNYFKMKEKTNEFSFLNFGLFMNTKEAGISYTFHF